jgi:hypothetical protein
MSVYNASTLCFENGAWNISKKISSVLIFLAQHCCTSSHLAKHLEYEGATELLIGEAPNTEDIPVQVPGVFVESPVGLMNDLALSCLSGPPLRSSAPVCCTVLSRISAR